MRILIVNDDGIDAAGIKILEKVTREFSDDVWVIAPETPQSAVGHSISFRNPLLLTHYDEHHIGVHGTPADCVVYALNGALKYNPPDIVFSGINKGANQCSDITCSGTICACIEAVAHGFKAIAFSQEGFVDTKWDTAEFFLRKMLSNLLAFPIKKNEFLNVNFPDAKVDEVKGIRAARQSIGKGRVLEPPRRHFEYDYYWIGELLPDTECKDNYDTYLLAEKYVTVMPLKVNLTAEDTLAELEALQW